MTSSPPPDNGRWAEVQIYRARLAVPPARLDAMLEALSILDNPPGAWEHVETGEAWIEAYGTSSADVAAHADAIAAIAETVDGCPRVAVVEPLPREDWTESWKRFFHVLHVTDRLVVRPVWEPYDAVADEIVIDIEPGMSFGTGLHPTTQACLTFLEQLAARGSAGRAVVDLGCGSGILAIAARKLGFETVSGYDYDPSAVRTARDNAATNGLTIPFAQADVCEPVLPVGDIVVANILASVLIAAAPGIARAVRTTPGHALVLAGILDSQYAEVHAAYAAQGFAERASLRSGEWRSGWFSR